MSILNFWKKQQSSSLPEQADGIHWDPPAQTALDQAVSQAPVPAMMKSMVKSQLKKAAEEYTERSGRTLVTAEDLMHGMMAKLPAHMKSKVEDALKKGPDGLKDLESELKK